MTPDQIKEFVSLYPSLEVYLENGPSQEVSDRSSAQLRWELVKADFDEIIFYEVRQMVASINA